ncbi:hypothetical protein GCM10010358_53640 [Streptomyces minutiscleroticus]|uniref:Uncharacterized protein n=1 Tax=Streptomyces minutiscleroticus TaxID=68238 RepID=A0A918NSQ0_9ACTN|nr:hypothetical protein GCM10010358_53640 [Streptomyces minutiscleroticus]
MPRDGRTFRPVGWCDPGGARTLSRQRLEADPQPAGPWAGPKGAGPRSRRPRGAPRPARRPAGPLVDRRIPWIPSRSSAIWRADVAASPARAAVLAKVVPLARKS